MSAGIKVVKGIEYYVKVRKPLDRVLRIFYVGVICDQFNPRVKLLCYLFRNQCFGLLDVFLSKEKLSVEIAEVYRIKIDDVNFAKA